MRSRIDNILLGLLWLLAATLATTFWFNIRFGFNIFAAQHWQYLGYLQASKSHVATVFYVSLGIAILITIFGLYVLIHPNIRKIALPILRTRSYTQDKATPPQNTASPAPAVSAPAPTQNTATPTPNVTPTTIPRAPEQTSTPNTATQATPQIAPAAQSAPRVMLQRPQRLSTNSFVAPPTLATMAAPVQAHTQQKSNTDENDATLRAIFEENGYIVKKNPFVSGFRPNLVAIGTNEVIYLGAIDATTVQVRDTIDKLNQVFTDTLEDVYIDINGFAVNAPDAATTEFEDILTFNSTDELADYMAQHQNSAPTPDEQENFDAYSEYIDTVLGYLGKL